MKHKIDWPKFIMQTISIKLTVLNVTNQNCVEKHLPFMKSLADVTTWPSALVA